MGHWYGGGGGINTMLKLRCNFQSKSNSYRFLMFTNTCATLLYTWNGRHVPFVLILNLLHWTCYSWQYKELLKWSGIIWITDFIRHFSKFNICCIRIPSKQAYQILEENPRIKLLQLISPLTLQLVPTLPVYDVRCEPPLPDVLPRVCGGFFFNSESFITLYFIYSF